MQSITFRQYRSIDLTIMAVLLAVSEGLTTLATTKWFVGVPFAISTTLIFMLIGMMRWDAYGIISALVGGAVFSIASGADIRQALIYILGNCLGLISLLFIRTVGKERVRTSPPYLVIYAVMTYLAVAVGRWLVSLIFEPSIRSLLVFITTDSVTLLFSIVIILLMRKVDGMIEDQRAYLIRQAEERESAVAPDYDDLSSVIEDPDYLDALDDESDTEQ